MRRKKLINTRLIWFYVPQTLPVLQLELEVLRNGKELPFESLEAKVEITLVIFWLRQEGQVTSPILLVLNTSSSNGLPQSAQTNSKIGMFYSAHRMSRC